MRAFLDGLTKRQLVDLVVELAASDDVASLLKYRQLMAQNNATPLMRNIRATVEALMAPDSEDEGGIDVEQLSAMLRKAVAQGAADDLLKLGDKLLQAGVRRIEWECYGDSSDAIGACIAVLFRALRASSLSPVARMVWAVDLSLKDGYGLTDEGAEAFWKQRVARKHWSALADLLIKRLETDAAADEALSCWAVKALDAAGREEEALEICRREADLAGHSVRLVDRLLATGLHEEAEHRIREGMAAARVSQPGVARDFFQRLVKLKRGRRDWPQVAALAAESFFGSPALHTFQMLKTAAEKARCWTAVREAALGYLETGKRPRRNAGWPLPVAEAAHPDARTSGDYPNKRVLIEIALAEKNAADVMRWYEIRRPNDRYEIDFHARVAAALSKELPDQTIAIWQQVAEWYIGGASYDEAKSYVKKVRDLLRERRRDREWRDYQASLYARHRLKRRFMEVLKRV